MRRASLAFAVLIVLAASFPAVASESSTTGLPEPLWPQYEGRDFPNLYRYAVANTLPGLEMSDVRYAITGNTSTDDRIWQLALARGYSHQPIALNGTLVSAPILMQPGAAAGWRTLHAEARQAGMGFVARSAYRSLATQRTMFNQRLSGSSDAAIETALRWAAPPGMSKHHSGYAIDFRYPDGTYGTFRSSQGYTWLARDNFAVAKRNGFIPSYPDGVDNQGPNPEPWEFVWVGTDLIRCGTPQRSLLTVAGPAAGLIADIERCPGGPAEPVAPGWLETAGVGGSPAP